MTHPVIPMKTERLDMIHAIHTSSWGNTKNAAFHIYVSSIDVHDCRGTGHDAHIFEPLHRAEQKPPNATFGIHPWIFMIAERLGMKHTFSTLNLWLTYTSRLSHDQKSVLEVIPP
jgi:hypothetical protein